jgi:hypothetical protein
MFRSSALWIVLAVALWTSPAQAQEAYLGVTAFGGAFFPTADLVNDEFKQTTSFIFGGRLSLWTLPRFAVELEGAYASSGLETYAGDQSGWFGAFSMNLLYSVIKPPLETFDIYLSGGLGFVKRSNEFFVEEEGLDEVVTDVAGVVGTGIRYGVKRGLYIRVDLKDYISWFSKPGVKRSELQNDLLVTAGIELNFRLGS